MQKTSKFPKYHVLAYVLMSLTIGVLGYRVYTLDKVIVELKQEIVFDEFKILDGARKAELGKSMITLQLLECKGVKKPLLDSLMIKLYHANEAILKRDSTHIAERAKQLLAHN